MGSSASVRNPQLQSLDLQHIRVLLVDDDPQAQALIEVSLADASFELMLEVVPNVTRGLERIADDDHDVYLIDQQLPDGTGLDLIATAKDNGATKPFILLTGYGSEALDAAALHGGAADYVEKHLVSTHLERSVRYALRNWQAGRALQEREEQLRHAQKMEAIGRLAGGVAHDFNNVLTAIIGYSDLIAERLNPEDQTARDVREIRRAADRAATLTRQLLAFSRKQFLVHTVLDVNKTVSGLLQMLPRVIGEHIETSVDLWPALGLVKADAAQLEQVVVNIVLNARDAMPNGGTLRIGTANVEMTEERIQEEALSIAPGDYVMLSIADNGIGMDAATRAHAFEPFFTTKPKGKGTGLGLATVYGIIDQSGGGIALDSAPGTGTTIRLYLPVTTDRSEPEQPPVAPIATEGTETLLFVEDNAAIRELSVRALRKRGYTVYDAGNADEAIAWSAATNVRPDLLVTDVVMPGLSGPNLAARLLQQFPRMHVLYMSGYSDDASAVHGAFWGGIPLVQKPFTPAQLAERVRMALDARRRAR
jgi:two-component system, cell cycle sensor histidine kinase and response regulator CckA